MARRRSTKNTSDREAFDFASDSELVNDFIKKNTFRPAPTVHLTPPTFDLRPIDDRRTYHPKPLSRPAGSLKRAATQLVIPKPSKASPRSALPQQVGFKAPRHVLVCVRRKQRKEVLFAKKLTKRGAGSKKHRNFWSSIKC